MKRKKGVTPMADVRRSKRLPSGQRTTERTKRLASFPLLNPNPVLEVDESGKITFANPAARKVLKSLGLDGRDPRPFLPSDMDVILKNLAHGKGVPLRREITIGSHVFGETINPIPRLNAVRIYTADISKRVRAEEALRRNDDRLMRAQEIAHLGSWELDLVQNQLTWSDEVYRIFGLRPQEFGATYEAFLERVHPDDRAAVDAAFSGSLRDNLDRYEIEHRVVRKDTGEIRRVHEKCEHFKDSSGRIVLSVGMVHDVTEQKRAEEILRRSHEELEELVRQRTAEIKKKDDFIRRSQKIEALGTLAGGIAHDFNNILSTVIINTELALFDLAGPARDQSPLPLVLEAAQRGRDLVKQIITFSRQREQERRPIRVAPVVKDALTFFRSSMPASIEIHADIEEDAGVVRADPSQIHQILMNLCVNAAHAMRERGGLLEVALRAVEVDAPMAAKHQELRPGPYLRLVVSDNGCGMTPDVAERAFDPFFTTKAPGEGSGLGLSVVHGIVQSYRGGIIVYSEPGRGSTFSVFLPRIQGEQEPAPGEAEIVRGAGERILLIEDEAVQLQSFAAMLERLGYAVTAKGDSGEALAVFEVNPGDFDLIITDQTMPKISGRQLAEAVLRIRPGTPIILSTGFSELVDREKAKAVGIREFIFKPFSLRDISTAIRRVLEGRRGANAGSGHPGGPKKT
ncbi:MAG: hybrid sensor histidine kinase/response regulator [Candidatus Aminicenantales bacterium]